jgi:hypothetical protein
MTDRDPLRCDRCKNPIDDDDHIAHLFAAWLQGLTLCAKCTEDVTAEEIATKDADALRSEWNL